MFASSIALIAPNNLACKAFPILVFSPNQMRSSELLCLKMPLQEDMMPEVEPSMLHFVQKGGGGGCQITSIILGALGGDELH